MNPDCILVWLPNAMPPSPYVSWGKSVQKIGAIWYRFKSQKVSKGTVSGRLNSYMIFIQNRQNVFSRKDLCPQLMETFNIW